MERREFLGSLSGPVVAVCAVCMGACSKSSGGSNVTAPTANFTIDLATNLSGIGSTIVQDGVIVVRLAAGNSVSSFTAVQVACTHEGTNINWNTGQNKFICPNHGSTFTSGGSVTLGPASSNLKVYNLSINGTILTVAG